MGVRGAHDHVRVSVEPGSDVQEELAVIVLPEDAYQLVVPPALTLGLAAGDVFAVDPETSQPKVLRRGGNLTIWLHPHGAAEEARSLSDEVAALGGTLEGSAHEDRVFIFTLPVTATFPAIEAVFNRFVEQHPESEWYFGNVYAADGVTPLGWWEAL